MTELCGAGRPEMGSARNIGMSHGGIGGGDR